MARLLTFKWLWGASFYWPSTCELEGMTPYSQVVYEYRLVLTIWLEANTLYGPEHPETLAAAERLHELKAELDERRLARAA
ncbi:MAG: hypothetical protein WDO18_06915 [Acidobacteriota bacterium]